VKPLLLDPFGELVHAQTVRRLLEVDAGLVPAQRDTSVALELGVEYVERVPPPPLEAPPGMERLLPIAARNGMQILGPPGPPPGH
jgi:hypothetical protein